MQSTAFEVLADPCRRRIVETLLAGEKQVNDIVAALDIHQSGVSRHLKILRAAGFVRVRPQGQMRVYCLEPAPFLAMHDWLGQYRALWEGRLERFGKALEKRKQAQPPARRKQGV